MNARFLPFTLRPDETHQDQKQRQLIPQDIQDQLLLKLQQTTPKPKAAHHKEI